MLTKASFSLGGVYDSDDEEARTIKRRLPKLWYTHCYVVELGLYSAANFLDGMIEANFSGTHGWMLEMIQVEEMRKMENGESRYATIFHSRFIAGLKISV